MPTTWKRCLLCDIGDIVSGGTPSTKDLSNFGGNIGWITPADMTGYTNKYIKEGKRNLTEKGLKKSSAVLLPKGTVLFSSRAPIGYIAITANPLATNQGFKNFIPNSKLVSSDFIYYLLWNSRNLIKSMASGTTFLEISAKRFAQVPVTLPPMAEQKRIVKKIEELFGVIDEQVKRLEATHAALVSYRQSILHSLFSSAIGEKVPLEKCLNYLQPTPYIVKSTDYMEAGEVPVLTPGKTFILGFTKEKEGIFTNPLPVIIFDDFTTSTKLVDFPFKVKSSAMKILLAKEGVDIRYIYYIMQILSCPHDTHKRYWISIYAKMRIILPSLPEQKAIVKKIENAFAFADKAQAAIIGALEQAKQLKQSILKRAFEGKLVPQDPNDKPVDLTQIKKDKHK